MKRRVEKKLDKDVYNIDYKRLWIDSKIAEFIETEDMPATISLLFDLNEYYTRVFVQGFDMKIYDYLHYKELHREYTKKI